MNAEEKVARQRLSVLQLAETLGSVSNACRQRGMTQPEVVRRILGLALAHPGKGFGFISDFLNPEGPYGTGRTMCTEKNIGVDSA